MLTPIFELDQDDDFVIVKIKVPHAKLDSTEVDFDDYEFKFFSKPYFLR